MKKTRLLDSDDHLSGATSTRCIVCDCSKSKKTIYGGYGYADKNYDILKCVNCGFMFVDPLPGDDILNDIYGGSDYFDNYYFQDTAQHNYLEGMKTPSRAIKKSVELLRRYKRSGRVLDVGCAGGRFIKHARDEGFDCEGVEPNGSMAAFLRDELGVSVKNMKIEDAIYDDKCFDVIHLGDAIEHIAGIEKSFYLCSKWLKDDGILFIEQPLSYNRSLFNMFLKANMYFSKNRFSENPPLHIWEFTPGTLSRFLDKKGYEVVFQEVFENTAKDISVYEKPGLKQYLSRWLKNISSYVSNLKVMKPFRMGDRAIFVCRKKKLKVLYVHPNLDLGGAETNRHSLLGNIDRHEYDLKVCCLSHKGEVANEIEKLGIEVACLDSGDDIYNLKTIALLYGLIRKGRYDIVHTCLANTNFIGRISAKLAGVPVIIAEEQSDYERYNRYMAPFMPVINRFLAGFTDKIIACSGNVSMSLAESERIDIDKFEIKYNCVDLGSFTPKRSREDIRTELSLRESSPVLCYVASLSERKGHVLLLRVVEILKRTHTDIKVLFVGKGPLREALERESKNMGITGNVQFLGERNDVVDILAASDVFVSTAVNEAFGINLIEAMYMKRPCVAFNVGGIPEVIDNGMDGVLVDPGDVGSMAGAVKIILSDTNEALRLGEAARHKVIDKFSAEKSARHMSELYKKLFAEKNE